MKKILKGSFICFPFLYFYEPTYIGMLGIKRTFIALGLEAMIYANYKINGFNDDTHDYCGKKLSSIIKINRGSSIKLGQNLALHHHVLPFSFVKHMEQFCQENPCSTFKEVKKLFKKETGKDIFEVFEYFDEKPVATGSIAQVHKAKFIDGNTVAVKIQHSQIINQTKGDVWVVKVSCDLAEYFFPDCKLKWIYKDFQRNMFEEVDFKKEVENMLKATVLFKKDKRIVVPKPYKNLCTDRIIVMSYEEGSSICDVNYRKKNQISVKEISNILNDVFNKQIFEYGFVHADPHQGNLFVRKEKINGIPRLRLVLLDFGLFINLDADFQRSYSKLWRGIFTQDKSTIAQACKELGVKEYEVFISMITGRDFKEVMNKDDISNMEKRLKIKKGKIFI